MKSEFLTNVSGQAQEDAEKTWAYVGRFLSGFALVELVINEIFITLFNLKGASLIFLGSSLDLRKKLELIQIVLSLRGEKTDIFGRMHRLSGFGLDKDGIDFDYVDKKGKLVLPKERAREKKNITRLLGREAPHRTSGPAAYAHVGLQT